jgi:hypothetical protein
MTMVDLIGSVRTETSGSGSGEVMPSISLRVVGARMSSRGRQP